MCRIPIKFEAYEEHYPPPEASDDCDFVLTEEISEIQKRMADLYQKQVEKGGIIDIEAEKNKYLLEISNVSYFLHLEPPHCIAFFIIYVNFVA